MYTCFSEGLKSDPEYFPETEKPKPSTFSTSDARQEDVKFQP